MRRDVGRHADRDAAGAVDEDVGKARGQDDRLELLLVVIGLEVDGVLVDILEQLHRDFLEPHLGVALRRGRVAVDRAEIALAVEQRHPHREVLRHAHQRVIDRQIAVRMIFAHHVAGDARGFVVGPVGREILLAHREQDAPVDRLQAVAHVGQRAADDHAHRVIEIAAPHLVGDRNGLDVGGTAGGGLLVLVVGQGLANPGWSLIGSSRRFRAAPPPSGGGNRAPVST